MVKKPEDIVKAAEAQGFTVKKVRHGWFIYPLVPEERPQWISRNSDGRNLQNGMAAARKAGVIL